MSVKQQTAQQTRVVVVLMSQDPNLLRDGYSSAEAARAKGYPTTVVELDPSLPDQKILQRVMEHGPGLTLMGVSREVFDRSLGASETLSRDGCGPVILFGRDLTFEEDRRRVPLEAASGVIVGDITSTLLDYLRVKRSDVSAPVAGLDRLDGDFRPRSPGAVWRRAPFPSFREADLVRLRREGLPMRLSAGCPRRCAFCNEQPREGQFRTRPVQRVVEEIRYHVQLSDVRRFRFGDLVLNGDLQQLENFCSLLLEQELEIEWWGRAMVNPTMSRALYRKMRLAGCIGLDFEIISGSDRILHTVGAGFRAEDASEAVVRASAAGINTRASIIIGLPGEAELEFGETAAWLHANRFNISQVKDILPAEIKEGSLLLRNHEEYGIGLPDEDPCINWHNGGFNNRSYRMKRTREMRIFVEDGLHLEVVGSAPEVTWDDERRAKVTERILDFADISLAETGRFQKENLFLAGVIRGKRALAGPPNLEIDLTNNCNQHCAGCWIHSFMLGDKRISGDKRRATLDYGVLGQLIRNARQMGTKRIQLSGAGEPFMHPRIDDVLALIKDTGFELNVITNFTMVDHRRARMLVDLGVDSVTISFWAGTAETYQRTHPTARDGLFEQVVDAVSQLTWYRRATGASRPRIKIYNVISALNAHEINEMIDVAREMGADLIEFTPIDIIKGYTDELALSQQDSERIIDQLINVRYRPDYLQRTAQEVTEGRLPGMDEQGEFARFLQRHRLPGDFRFSLKDIRAWESYCRRGIHCSRVYEEIHRDSAIFFGHPACECLDCMAFVDCSIDPITLTVRAPYLSLQGFGSFWRRVAGKSSGEDAKRDAKIVDKIPCSIGYTYARVQATGHVIPCCKAADFPLGNILEGGFEKVWTSEAYEVFRQKALVTAKSDPYFEPMDCYKVCDNLGHNMQTTEAIDGLHPFCRQKLEEE